MDVGGLDLEGAEGERDLGGGEHGRAALGPRDRSAALDRECGDLGLGVGVGAHAAVGHERGAARRGGREGGGERRAVGLDGVGQGEGREHREVVGLEAGDEGRGVGDAREDRRQAHLLRRPQRAEAVEPAVGHEHQLAVAVEQGRDGVQHGVEARPRGALGSAVVGGPAGLAPAGVLDRLPHLREHPHRRGGIDASRGRDLGHEADRFGQHERFGCLHPADLAEQHHGALTGEVATARGDVSGREPDLAELPDACVGGVEPIAHVALGRQASEGTRRGAAVAVVVLRVGGFGHARDAEGIDEACIDGQRVALDHVGVEGHGHVGADRHDPPVADDDGGALQHPAGGDHHAGVRNGCGARDRAERRLGADALGADGAEEEQGRQGGETDANGHATAGEAARR